MKLRSNLLSVLLSVLIICFSGGCSEEDSGAVTLGSAAVQSDNLSVISTSPADGDKDVTTETIQITFSEEVDSSSLTSENSNGSCTDNIQISNDDFSNCGELEYSSSSKEDSTGYYTYTFNPEGKDQSESAIKIKVIGESSGVKAKDGSTMTSNYVHSEGFTVAGDNDSSEEFSALDLDGSTKYIKNPSKATIGIGETFTVGIWFKFDTTSSDHNNLLHVTPGLENNSFEVMINSADNKLRVRVYDEYLGSNYKDFKGSTVMTSGTTYYGVITYNGNVFNIYLNGAAEDLTEFQNDSISNMTNEQKTVFIGSDYGQAYLFDGKIHSVALWDFVLAGSDVTELYDNGNPGVDLTKANGSSNLKHWWKIVENEQIGKDYATPSVDLTAGVISESDVVTFEP